MSSPFSGRAGRLAAMWEAQYLSDQQGKIDTKVAKGRKSSLDALGKGYKDAKGAYGDAIDLYDPYRETGLKAFGQYADATGVNGQEGHDRAVGNFRAGPGYEWQQSQGVDGVARKASALGALGSGNTMTAIADYSSNLADQEYDDYLDRLDGVSQTGFAATGAQAGLTKGIGDLGYNYGADKAGVNQWGTGLGVSTLANTSGAIADAGQKGMMAGQEAAATRMNFGLQTLGAGLQIAGLPMGGGNTLGGNLFKRWGA